jgi:hypothetical protein
MSGEDWIGWGGHRTSGRVYPEGRWQLQQNAYETAFVLGFIEQLVEECKIARDSRAGGFAFDDLGVFDKVVDRKEGGDFIESTMEVTNLIRRVSIRDVLKGFEHLFKVANLGDLVGGEVGDSIVPKIHSAKCKINNRFKLLGSSSKRIEEININE